MHSSVCRVVLQDGSHFCAHSLLLYRIAPAYFGGAVVGNRVKHEFVFEVNNNRFMLARYSFANETLRVELHDIAEGSGVFVCMAFYINELADRNRAILFRV